MTSTPATPPATQIHPLSVVPLHVECLKNGKPVGAATGYVVTQSGAKYLITNWHVATGREPSTGQPVSPGSEDPETIRIWHHSITSLGWWTTRDERLVDAAGVRVWLEHPQGRRIDIVAVPITQGSAVQFYELDMGLANADLIVQPSEPVSIIGFPFGHAVVGKLAIWKTGHVASDIDLNYEGDPKFLIDATTRPGMSGSPVAALRVGTWATSTGVIMAAGGIARFLGTYSAHYPDAELGIVWRPHVLSEILATAA